MFFQVVLNPNYLDTFMMLSVDLLNNKAVSTTSNPTLPLILPPTLPLAILYPHPNSNLNPTLLNLNPTLCLRLLYHILTSHFTLP